MGRGAERVAPRCAQWLAPRQAISDARARLVQKLSGVALEIAFGARDEPNDYPREVTKVLALDATSGRLEAAHSDRVERVVLRDDALELADASVDCAISTFSLCTLEQPTLVLSELRRVLKPGGDFLFLEHGRSPDRASAKWQDRLAALAQLGAAGCRVNRALPDHVREAGFCLYALDEFYAAGPKPISYIFEGWAKRC